MRVTRSDGRQQFIPLPSRGRELLNAPGDAACSPLAALAAWNAAWVRKVGAGSVEAPRAVWAGGVGLGVTDEAARRLWPALFAEESKKVHVPAVVAKKASPRPGTPVPGLPCDEELAREHAEAMAHHHDATARLAAKYGCNRATIQRRVNKGNAARRPSFFPRVAGGKC